MNKQCISLKIHRRSFIKVNITDGFVSDTNFLFVPHRNIVGQRKREEKFWYVITLNKNFYYI